jgi:L-threonylcarbamoyladenylate synthase
MPERGCEILPVDPRAPDEQVIKKVASRINGGGLVVFPTNTFYGLGAKAMDADAVERVYRAKKRSPAKPLLILIASPADLSAWVQSVPDMAKRIMKAFWPGSVTLVFQSKESLPANLTGHTGKIGIRLAGHPVALALVRELGSPVTGTSANISGNEGATSVNTLNGEILEHVDLVLDAGGLGGGKGSTIVDVTVDPPTILREGTISADKIKAVLDG